MNWSDHLKGLIGKCATFGWRRYMAWPCVMQWKVEVSTKREIIKRENLFLLLFFAIFIWFSWRYRPITTRPSCYPPLLLFPSLSEKSIFSSSSSAIITWTGACRGVWHCWTKYIFCLAVSGAEISSYPPPIPPRRPGTRLSIWQCFFLKKKPSVWCLLYNQI